MFENLGSFLFKVSIIIFFVLGITLFLLSQRSIIELIDLGEKSYLQSNSVRLNDEVIESSNSFGYEIIVQKMSYNELSIVVDGETIESKNDLLLIETEENYLKNIVLDESGQLMYIEYKRK
jgi:hypothetical protein